MHTEDTAGNILLYYNFPLDMLDESGSSGSHEYKYLQALN